MNDHEVSRRYSRQELFAPIGQERQQALREKHVLIIGAGALGSTNAESLVRSGVGTISIVDRDYVEWSNLQRQQLYTEADATQRLPKAVAAQAHLRQINSEVTIHAYVMDVVPDELQKLMTGVDLIIDACDNFDTRYLINDISQQYNIPWIYGACVGSYGITYTIIPGKTPCLSCIMGVLSNGGGSCDLEGIIPSAVQMVVANQTAEALKVLTDNMSALRGKLLSFDLWTHHYVAINVDKFKRLSCTSCGEHPVYPYLQAANHEKVAVLCGRETVHIRPARPITIHPQSLSAQVRKLGLTHEVNPYLIAIQLKEQRLVLFADGRALVHGTDDIVKAKGIYHQFVE